jgi:dTDP-4-dehydrorhamnose 3,5-epimerase
MKKILTEIEDVFLIEPDIYQDSRGYFFETYNSDKMLSLGISTEFLQDNQSFSAMNVLRGLHFQVPPFAQGKLVRAIKGSVLDVAVDLRKDSTFYGKYVSRILSETNHLMMWIPQGFAHGFLALEKDTVFSYKCTQVYHQASERTINWNDPVLDIRWGITNPIVSEKDNQALSFSEFSSPF